MNITECDEKNINQCSCKKTLPTSVWAILTESCNLRCTYCFERYCDYSGGVMSEETAYNTIEYLINNAKILEKDIDEDNRRGINFTFFGGEPTLVPGLCKKIIEYTKKRCTEENVKYDFYIVTNGTIFNDDVKDMYLTWFNATGKAPRVQLSLEGLPSLQDIGRPSANKNISSSQLVRETVAKYKEFYDEQKWSWDNVCVHCVLSKKSLPYAFKSYEYIWRTLGITDIGFGWVIEDAWDDEDMEILQKNVSKISGFLNERTTNEKRFPFKVFDNGCSGCGSGRSLITVTPDGTVYACHRFYFFTKNKQDVDLSLGNINNETNKVNEEIRQKYIDLDTHEITDKDCQVCIATNYELTGQMDKIPDDYVDIKIQRVLKSERRLHNLATKNHELSRLLEIQRKTVNELKAVVNDLKNKIN